MTVDYFGYEPWYFIDEDNFYSVLDEMICDPEYRKKYADLGRKHLERYHSGLNVVKKTESLYNQLLK